LARIPYTTNPKAKRVEVRFPDDAPFMAAAWSVHSSVLLIELRCL